MKTQNLKSNFRKTYLTFAVSAVARIIILLALILLSAKSAQAEFLKLPSGEMVKLSEVSNKDKMLEYTLTIKITKYAHKHNLERRLLSCLLKVESNYNIKAISPTNDFGIGQINMYNIERKNLDMKRLTSDVDYSIEQAAAHLNGVQQLFRPFEPSTWPCRYNIGNRSITTPGLGAACVAYNAKLTACYRSNDYL